MIRKIFSISAILILVAMFLIAETGYALKTVDKAAPKGNTPQAESAAKKKLKDKKDAKPGSPETIVDGGRNWQMMREDFENVQKALDRDDTRGAIKAAKMLIDEMKVLNRRGQVNEHALMLLKAINSEEHITTDTFQLVLNNALTKAEKDAVLLALAPAQVDLGPIGKTAADGGIPLTAGKPKGSIVEVDDVFTSSEVRTISIPIALAENNPATANKVIDVALEAGKEVAIFKAPDAKSQISDPQILKKIKDKEVTIVNVLPESPAGGQLAKLVAQKVVVIGVVETVSDMRAVIDALGELN